METPTRDYRRTSHRVPTKPLAGLDAWVNAAVGKYRRRKTVASELLDAARRIDSLAPQYKDLPDRQLQEKLLEFRAGFRRHRAEAIQTILPDALAAIRETSDRQLGLRPFPVQLMGALTLHRGLLAEMATGEGKTLTAGLAAVLAGWTGQPCHIITANDYLVQRDAEWLRPLYQFCRLRAGFVTGQMPAPDRRKGYDADITYTTSKEIVADFLRDRLRLGVLQDPTRRMVRSVLNPFQVARLELVMRGLHTAIVDEADCLLIDEAVTPLIISAPMKNDTLRNACLMARDMVDGLLPGEDYEINPRHKEIDLTDTGRSKIQSRCNRLPGLFRSLNRRDELARQALVAREFFHNGRQYVLNDGKVSIVDEFTGRIMPQRTWRAGLHQAIEAKENIEITDPTETLARLSFQRFYRLFHRLSGMTGTGHEAAGEFWQVYGLPVIGIPTHRPCIRTSVPDRIFAHAEQKWQAIEEDVVRVHQTGRPILIGTRSITASESLADRLRGRGLTVRVLNALRLLEEAQIVSEAGEENRITIATNMAGRGTDIRLAKGIAERGGLHVIATERHESHRIDRQLFGRAARQGDPGSARAFISLEDELLQRFIPAPILERVRAGVAGSAVWARYPAATLAGIAQKRAERQAYKQRAGVLRMDTWLSDALSFTGGPKGL